MPRVERFFAGQNVADWMGGSLGGAASTPITATGGTTNTYTGYKSHKFTASGTFTVTDGAGEVEVMIIAGGGGGGNKDNAEENGGGAGAGGMCVGSLYCEAGTYTVTIGAGGAVGSEVSSPIYTGMPRNGSDSRVGIAFAIGGGAGGSTNQSTANVNGDLPRDGSVGGSGGGGTSTSGGGNAVGVGGNPITGQGYHGGQAGGTGGSVFTGHSTGGGGGAGAVGATTSTPSVSVGRGVGGNGGAGATNDYETGVDQTYCGGGAGCASGLDAGWVTVGTGGSGGGGNGGTHLSSGTRVSGTSGTANTGGGGGGGSGASPGAGGSGGSGIVVIRYAA